jgi:hypothetical protein
MRELVPARFVAIRTLHDSFANVVMTSLNNPVSLRVIRGDTDVSYIVPVCKLLECGHEGRAIVSNDFSKRSPSTEDVLENERRESQTRFRMHHVPFRIRGHRASCLDEIAKPARLRHEHGVNMRFAKQASRYHNRRRDMKLRRLTDLTLVAGLDVPLDVF